MDNAEPLEHWTSHIGLFGWYKLAFPPSWSLIERQGHVLLRPAEGQATLSLTVSWSNQPADPQSALKKLLIDKYAHRRRMQVRGSAHPGNNTGWHCGETLLQPPASFWKRLWERGNWQKFQVTVIAEGHLLLMAELLQGNDVDPEFQTLAQVVIQTLKLNPAPCDPPNVFIARAVDFIRQAHPDLNCQQAGDLQIHLGGSTVSLVNFYREYLHRPNYFEAILENAVGTLVNLQKETSGNFRPKRESVVHRLIPMLYPQKSIRNAVGPGLFDTDHWEGGPLQLATREANELGFVCEGFAADLAMTYVVDEEQAYWYVQPAQLEDWEMTYEELRSIALENLDRHFEAHPMEMTVIESEHGPAVAMPTKPDAYNAARLASESFRERLRLLLGGSCVVGVPNRDFFVAVSLSCEETVEQIRERVTVDHHQMTHPLTSRLLLITADGVSEYV